MSFEYHTDDSTWNWFRNSGSAANGIETNSHVEKLVRKENICFKLIIEFKVLNKLPNWNRQSIHRFNKLFARNAFNIKLMVFHLLSLSLALSLSVSVSQYLPYIYFARSSHCATQTASISICIVHCDMHCNKPHTKASNDNAKSKSFNFKEHFTFLIN